MTTPAYTKEWQRTMMCGAPRAEHAGRQVVLNGWLRARENAQLIFPLCF